MNAVFMDIQFRVMYTDLSQSALLLRELYIEWPRPTINNERLTIIIFVSKFIQLISTLLLKDKAFWSNVIDRQGQRKISWVL